jgi:hypothetical protein
MATTPVLDLDNLTPHAAVRIGGATVEMRTVEMLPPIERHRLFKMGRRIAALEAKAESEDLSEAEEKELEDNPAQMCRLILRADDAVVAQMTPDQRVEVLAAFLNPSRMTRQAETESPSNSTGATSAPA